MSPDAHGAPVEPGQSAPPPLQIPGDSPVLAAIVAACERAADFDFAGPSAPLQSSIYRLPVDLVALFNTLSQRFSREALRAAGVTPASPAGHGALTPWFVPAGQFQALHRTIDADPFELVSHAGCLRGDWLAVEAARHDFLGGGAERIAVAFELGHVAALQALGVPTVLGAGLDRLSDAQRERLLGRTPEMVDDDDDDDYDHDEVDVDAAEDDVDEDSAEDESVDDGGEAPRGATRRRGAGPELALVAWNPATISRTAPTGLPEAIEALAAAGRLGYCVSAINVWRPDERDLAALRDAVQIKSKAMTEAVAARMLKRPMLTLEAYRAQIDREHAPPPSLAELRRRLELKIEARPDRYQRTIHSAALATSLAAYRQALRDVSVEPLRAMSADAPPPCRPLYQVAVGVADELVALDELSRRAERALGRLRTDVTTASPDEDAARRDELTRRYSKTIAEIHRLSARRAPRKARPQ